MVFIGHYRVKVSCKNQKVIKIQSVGTAKYTVPTLYIELLLIAVPHSGILLGNQPHIIFVEIPGYFDMVSTVNLD